VARSTPFFRSPLVSAAMTESQSPEPGMPSRTRLKTSMVNNSWTLVIAGSPVLFWVGYAWSSASSQGLAWRIVACATLAFDCWLMVQSAHRVIALGSASTSRQLWSALMSGFMMLNLYLLGFSTVYLAFGGETSAFLAGPNASDKLGRLDALYFTMTTFTTTGFGDWHPVSEGARAVVVAQLASGFVVVSVLLALVLSTVTALRRQQFE